MRRGWGSSLYGWLAGWWFPLSIFIQSRFYKPTWLPSGFLPPGHGQLRFTHDKTITHVSVPAKVLLANVLDGKILRLFYLLVRERMDGDLISIDWSYIV
jgi:hypothetical protein